MRHQTLAKAMSDFLDDPAFPCVAAKSALKQRQVISHSYGSLTDAHADHQILADIYAFIAGYRASGSLFQSCILEFNDPQEMTELEFEQAIWERLQALSDLDQRRFDWDQRVAADPEAPAFSFSLGGEAFFIIGMHPGASRASRRYVRPALALNLHDQFERLRADGRYDRMRDVIRRRDEAYCGFANPVLRNFGDLSEARQYSGRAVSADWKCPFRPGLVSDE
jgi:uncharacterized protein